MYLVISKKFEISLSYRYFRSDWSPEKNTDIFGRHVGGEHGYGANINAYFIFHGPVNRDDGMVINVALIKSRIKRLLSERYDHKFLNRNTPPFDSLIPTPENLARQMLLDAGPLFSPERAELVACHLDIPPDTAATAYADGRVERDCSMEFSAARRTWSPHLSDDANQKLFGPAAAPSGHGHSYRLKASLAGDIDPHHGMIVTDKQCAAALGDIHDLLDHKNLSTDIPDLHSFPMTTEYLSKFLFERLSKSLPINRLRLWENPYFSAEYLGDDRHLMSIETAFHAAHRLHSPYLSDGENEKIYGKCNNQHGHGHRYRLEVTIAGDMDKQSGTVFSLLRFQKAVDKALIPWDYRHLDLDTDDFKDKPSTGENIISVLWPRIEDELGHPLHRLRLWETPNNRFTLRRSVEKS